MDSKVRRRVFVKTSVVIILSVVVVLCFLTIKLLLSGMHFMRTTGITPGLAAELIFKNGVTLKSSNGRTNILLLGVGGGTHEGADLTDTMLVVSLSSKDQSVALISIPRDIWSETLKDRVNSAYHYGEAKKKGSGLLLARVIAEDIIGMPIQHSILVDFSGFKDIIDVLGGIEVNVSRGFTDSEYPIEGKTAADCPKDPAQRCLYETIKFDQGIQHMDGQRALKYVRSRHAEGEEGSDFARGRRAQDVLVSLREILIHPTRWFSLEKVSNLQKVIDSATESDLNFGELLTVMKRLASSGNGGTHKISIESLLYTPPAYMYGRYVLIPKEDWDAIHTYISQSIESTGK